MNIQSVNHSNQSFGAQIKILHPSPASKFHINLQEFVDKNGYIIEEYAERHGFKNINLCLKEASKILPKANEHGDVLLINSGIKPTMMKYDHTTSELQTRKTILQNIQDNYNLLHPKK